MLVSRWLHIESAGNCPPDHPVPATKIAYGIAIYKRRRKTYWIGIMVAAEAVCRTDNIPIIEVVSPADAPSRTIAVLAPIGSIRGFRKSPGLQRLGRSDVAAAPPSTTILAWPPGRRTRKLKMPYVLVGWHARYARASQASRHASPRTHAARPLWHWQSRPVPA